MTETNNNFYNLKGGCSYVEYEKYEIDHRTYGGYVFLSDYSMERGTNATRSSWADRIASDFAFDRFNRISPERKVSNKRKKLKQEFDKIESKYGNSMINDNNEEN